MCVRVPNGVCPGCAPWRVGVGCLFETKHNYGNIFIESLLERFFLFSYFTFDTLLRNSHYLIGIVYVIGGVIMRVGDHRFL